jgi:predicted O-methyltransferase YrrM
MKSKAISLLSLLPRRPIEFYERVADYADLRKDTILRSRTEYQAISIEEGIASLFDGQNSDSNKILVEGSLTQIERHVKKRQAELPPDAPFGLFHNGDPWLARLCYLAVRILRPTKVVETGVCYGVTSAYLLAAMNENNHGQLHSIDLPPLGTNGDDFIGWLVPDELKDRWMLHRGTSDRLLGSLVTNLGTLDLFIHDSLHTYKNMKQEYETSWPALRPGGILISDDIEGNEAFLQMIKLGKPEFSVVMKEENKDSLVGVAVKGK